MKRIKTLLLNANFQPRAIIPVERAFALVFEDSDAADGIGKVEVILTAKDVATDEIPDQMKEWHSPTRAFAVPLVVALRKMHSPLFDLFNAPNGNPNRRALIKRDRGRCLYCLRTEDQLEPGNILTMDHIVPRHRFQDKRDAHHYGNLALACLDCNLAKGGRTPEEAGMTLHGVPLEPTRWDLVSSELLQCQRVFVKWCREGGPIPHGLMISAA